MGDLLTIFRFGWVYLQRYWGRLLIGVLLGILYGMVNGSFMFVSKLMAERLIPAAATVPTNSVLRHLNAEVNIAKSKTQNAPAPVLDQLRKELALVVPATNGETMTATPI